MELLYRYGELKVSVVYGVSDGLNGLNEQRLIAERFGCLDEGLVSRDRRGIGEKIHSIEDPKVVSGSHQAKCISQVFDRIALRDFFLSISASASPVNQQRYISPYTEGG